MALKNLAAVRNIVESIGMEIGYVYEDLIFLDHNALILQFSTNEETVLIHENSEADRDSLQATIILLANAAEKFAMRFVTGKSFTLARAEDENLRLEFAEV